MTVPPFTLRLRFTQGVGTYRWDFRGTTVTSIDASWSSPITPTPEQVAVCLAFGVSRSAIFTNQPPKLGDNSVGGRAEVEITSQGKTWTEQIDLQADEPWAFYAWPDGIGTGPEWVGAVC